MENFCIVNYLKCSDFDGIKEFISRGGDVLKALLVDFSVQTPLNYMINNYKNSLSDVRDEIILCLIDEEVKARCTKNMWDNGEWNAYLEKALFYGITEKVVLKLIRAGSANIIDYQININCILTAICNKYVTEVITNLLKYCLVEDLQAESDKLLGEAIENDCDIDVIKILVGAGANLQAIIDQDIINCECCNGHICKSKHVIDFLVKNSVDLKALDSNLNTIIHRTNCRYLIYLAIKNGVSINQENGVEYSPVMQAIKYGRLEKVNTLLQFGADPNYSLNFYLIYSMADVQETYSSEDLVDLLLYHGADFLLYTVKNASLSNRLLYPWNIFTNYLKKVVYYFIFFMGANDFSSYFPYLSNSGFWLSFSGDCEVELDKMKSIVLNDELTLYDFCYLKKFYKSKFVDISVSEFESYVEKMTEIFPIYCDFIKIRIKDNVCKRWKKVLTVVLENIVIATINNIDDMSLSAELNYDSLYYLSKFLNSKDLYNLFLASTSV